MGVLRTLALIPATAGIFGMIAYFVNRGGHEIGIRRALGARTEDGWVAGSDPQYWSGCLTSNLSLNRNPLEERALACNGDFSRRARRVVRSTRRLIVSPVLFRLNGDFHSRR